MCVRVSAGVRELADNRAEKVGLTRFFRNPRVTADEILRTAAARTGAAATGRHVLLIEDTSEINYQAKAKRKRGLGPVGNGADVGLFVRPALAIDAEDGAVLGLAGATIWRRTRVKEDDYQNLPIEEKESHRWIATALKARTFLSTAALVTLITDREGDIYELFARVPDEQTHVLVRAEHDRALADVGGRMLAKIAAQPEAGRVAFDLTGRPGRTARRVTLAVRFCPVTLRQPRRGADRGDPPQLSLNLVEAREIDPPPGEDPIVWRLLTTHVATSLAEATRIIDLYRCRWIVEQLFRNRKAWTSKTASSATAMRSNAWRRPRSSPPRASCNSSKAAARPVRTRRPRASSAGSRSSSWRCWSASSKARPQNRRTRTPSRASPGRPGASPGSAAGTATPANDRPARSPSPAACVASTLSRKASCSPPTRAIKSHEPH
jgi:hypothetical protein